jgi:hypothetical protein
MSKSLSDIDVKNENSDIKLAKQELELEKLRLEIEILENTLEDSKPKERTAIQNFIALLKKNIGYITSIGVVIGGLVTPILDYVAERKNNQMITINSSLVAVLDSTELNNSTLVDVSSSDPAVAAPFLLSQLDNGTVSQALVTQIYQMMYRINQDKPHRSLTDKILFLFVKDNSAILEDELRDHAEAFFSLPLDGNREWIASTYLALMDTVHAMNNKADFNPALDVIRQKCGSADSTIYKGICFDLKKMFGKK